MILTKLVENHSQNPLITREPPSKNRVKQWYAI